MVEELNDRLSDALTSLARERVARVAAEATDVGDVYSAYQADRASLTQALKSLQVSDPPSLTTPARSTWPLIVLDLSGRKGSCAGAASNGDGDRGGSGGSNAGGSGGASGSGGSNDGGREGCQNLCGTGYYFYNTATKSNELLYLSILAIKPLYCTCLIK